MKLILQNTTMVFRNLSLPTEWDYDVLGVFFSGAEAWAANTSGNPIYYLLPSASGYKLLYKESSSAGGTEISMSEGDMLRVFGGDIFLEYTDNNLSLITLHQQIAETLTVGQVYNYDSSTNRVSDSPTSFAGWSSCKVSVQAGDIIMLKGQGGTNAKLFAIQTASSCYIPADGNTRGLYVYYKITENATLYVNSANSSSPVLNILRPRS